MRRGETRWNEAGRDRCGMRQGEERWNEAGWDRCGMKQGGIGVE